MLTPACQRAIFVLSIGILMFASKIYNIPDLTDILKSLIPHNVSTDLAFVVSLIITGGVYILLASIIFFKMVYV